MPLTTAEKQLQVLPFARPWSLSAAPVHLLSTRYDNEPVQVIGQVRCELLDIRVECCEWLPLVIPDDSALSRPSGLHFHLAVLESLAVSFHTVSTNDAAAILRQVPIKVTFPPKNPRAAIYAPI